MNVYPRVIEDCLHEHAEIREVAVVGESHRLHGEIPIVYVARTEGSALTAEQVKSFCQARLGRHEVPRRVFFKPELPKNPTGKILKRELRKQGEIERGIECKEIDQG